MGQCLRSLLSGRMQTMADALEEAERVAAALESAWNDADGAAWGAKFTVDADFIGFKGRRATTRAVIAEGHQGLFDAECADRTMRFEVVQARKIARDVILAHMLQHLSRGIGHEEDMESAIGTVLLVRAEGSYRIAAYHNTLAT